MQVPETLLVLLLLHIAKKATSLAISSHGELLVSGSFDGTVRRWRARTGSAVGQPIRGCDLLVYGLTVKTMSLSE